MAQGATGEAEGQKPKEPNGDAKDRDRKYESTDVWMLLIIMASLTGLFLGGLGITLGVVGAEEFDAAAIVAILSPALAAVGTVAAGVFGYTVGTRGTAGAQESATVARQEAAATAQEGGTPVRDIERIFSRASEGGELTAEGLKPGTYGISADDLNTLLADVEPLARRLGIGLPEAIPPAVPATT